MLGRDIEKRVKDILSIGFKTTLSAKRYQLVLSMLDREHDYRFIQEEHLYDSERLRMEIIAEQVNIGIALNRMKDLCS